MRMSTADVAVLLRRGLAVIVSARSDRRHMAEASDVPSEVRALVSQLTEPKPMRRGSVTERYVKCNKAGCPCARREDARHGPYYSVSRVVKGRTQSRWLDAKQAQLVRHQVEAAQQFRKQVQTYWEACERWADCELALSEAGSGEAAEKGGSRRPSLSRSPRRSKRS